MLHVQETWIDRTRNIGCGDSDVYETGHDTHGDLYRAMQQEYGRCIGRIYIDPDAKVIGWVFQQRIKYDDCNDTFLRETWVTVHTAAPTKTVEFHYA